MCGRFLGKNLEDSVDSLGKDVAFVEKWPWEFGPDYKWWKYMNRPNPNLAELKKSVTTPVYNLQQRSPLTCPIIPLKMANMPQRA